VWVEVMNWLNRNEAQTRKTPPPGLVKARIEFSRGLHPAREEWFIRGTEPRPIEVQTGPPPQQILYPPAGTVFALDPDIPRDLQKIFFILKTSRPGVTWILDGHSLPALGKATPWSPEAGRHHLALKDEDGRVIDSVRFVVRGVSPEGNVDDGEPPATEE
jgi:penicillin-binding protein 1C